MSEPRAIEKLIAVGDIAGAQTRILRGLGLRSAPFTTGEQIAWERLDSAEAAFRALLPHDIDAEVSRHLSALRLLLQDRARRRQVVA